MESITDSRRVRLVRARQPILLAESANFDDLSHGSSDDVGELALHLLE